MKQSFLFALAACAALALSSCAKKSGDEGVGTDGDYVTGTPLPDRVEGANFFGGTVDRGQFQPVYFSYDSFTISDAEMAKLDAVSQAMKGMKKDIIIAGFTDAAGTEEYNRGLGERRAQAVREALIGLGVSGARVQTVSFGEEMPVPGGDDAKNRRAEFGVINKRLEFVAVPLLDLTRQYAQIRDVVMREIDEVVTSQQFILGRKVEEFEAAFVNYSGCGHAVGMSSGTDAQLAILMALGIGAGDAVVTTPYTFFATAGCIHRAGAETVFVDIDPVTLNLDPQRLAECLRERCTLDADGSLRTPRGNRVRAIIPVHLFGLCCEMDAIRDLAREFDLVVIEDAAQAIGAEYPSRDGTVQAGAIGEFGYFSFFPAKNLGAFGDAGLSTCADAAHANALRLMRNHGMEQRYYHHQVGGNFRIDALQAAILHAKLSYVGEWNAARRANAAKYAAAFDAAGVMDFVTLPATPFAGRVAEHHIFHQYVMRAQRRDELLAHLASHGIGHGVYYPVPLHLQECFSYLGYKSGDFPESERAAAETVALPIYPELRDEELAEVVEVVSQFFCR